LWRILNMSRKRAARLLSSLRSWSWPRYWSPSGRAFLPRVARIRRTVLGLESLEAIAAAGSLLPALAPFEAAASVGIAEPPSQAYVVEWPSGIADSSMTSTAEADRAPSDLRLS